MTTSDAAVADAPAAATPLVRLVAAMFASNVGALVALVTPLQLLLTLKLNAIAGTGATAAFGVVTGFGALFALVAYPLAGRISDRTTVRFGRRRTWILAGALATALALFTQAYTTQVWQVVLVWCATQTVLHFQMAATNALLADQVPAGRRGTISGVVGFSITVGPLIGLAAVGGAAGPVAQWTILAGISVVLGVLAVALMRDPRHRRPAGQTGLNVAELLRSYWVNPWRHPAFGWAWLLRFLITCAYASNTYTAFFVMQRFGVTPKEIGAIILALSTLSIGLLGITSIVAGAISDRIRRQKPFVITAGLISAIALVLLATAPTMAMVWVAQVLLGVGPGLFYAVDNALCVRVLPSEENAGKDLGIINLANTLSQSFVPFVAPLLLGLGGFPTFYGVLAVLAVVGAGAVLRLPEIGREGDARWAAITRQPLESSAH
jgi:MFS family permease